MGDREMKDKQEKPAHQCLQTSSFKKYMKEISDFSWIVFLFQLNYVTFYLLLFCYKDVWIPD